MYWLQIAVGVLAALVPVLTFQYWLIRMLIREVVREAISGNDEKVELRLNNRDAKFEARLKEICDDFREQFRAERDATEKQFRAERAATEKQFSIDHDNFNALNLYTRNTVHKLADNIAEIQRDAYKAGIEIERRRHET